MIEQDITNLEERIDEQERKFEKLVTALRDAFGDADSGKLRYQEFQIADLNKKLEIYKKSSADNAQILVEVANTLGCHGGITRENLLKFARKAMGKEDPK